MPRSSKPWWGARAHYELQIDSTSPAPTEIERNISAVAAELGILGPVDFAAVCQDAATIAAWSQQVVPERRRIRQALIEVGRALGALENTLDSLPPPFRDELRTIRRSDQFDPEWCPEVTLLFEYPRQLHTLSMHLRRAEANQLADLSARAIACADTLVRLDDFSQGHLLDGLMQQDLAPVVLDPAGQTTVLWLRMMAQYLRWAAEQEAQRLSRKGRDDHPWLHWAVLMLAERYESLTDQKVTYYLDDHDTPVASRGGLFIIGVIRASGATVSEIAVLNAIRRHVRAIMLDRRRRQPRAPNQGNRPRPGTFVPPSK